jgi:5'(3')-deoxyribonucleotidase
MKKLHIMIDCDDVLNNLSEDWVKYLNKQHGLDVNPQGISHKNIFEAFPMLSRDEVKSPMQDGIFSGTYTVKPGSYECLKEMVDDGHEVSIVTAHINKTTGMKIVWIKTNFPFLSRDNIIITSKKHKIMGDVLIDDSIYNLLEGNHLKILFDHPNNHGYDAEANGMIRVYTLKEAYEVIQKELTG